MITRFALVALVLAPAAGFAEQRALLVGVGNYQTPGIDLPGIDLDIERMRETLVRLGFQPRQIRALLDEEATSTNVIANFDTWLKQGVRSEDRVVFYFSGHGSNVPDLDSDEADGADEVLVTHDMRRAKIKGRASLAGVVTDDKIAELIAGTPSKNVLIIVDACHSGTMTRSFRMKNRSIGSDAVFVKSFTYAGMPENTSSGLTRGIERAAAPSNYVALSAAGDAEKAIGTMKGGVFTIGFTEAVAQAATAGKAISINDLRVRAAEYIAAKVDKSEVHHPQITGSSALAQSALKLAAPAEDGPNRKRLLELAAAQARKIDVTPSNAKYALDEPVILSVNVPAAGFLNVVTVDAKDNATVLFPNHHHESNAVTPGKLSIPTPDMAFELLASEPTGSTLVVAFLSTDKINFYQETLDNRDENGNITVDFTSLSHSATRAIRVAPRRSETYAGQLEIEIVPKTGGRP